MDEKKELTIDQYRTYVLNNMPMSWHRVSITHNVQEQVIQAITNYCYEYKLLGRELYCHLHENELICAANWGREPQGTDWWMSLSTEANMLENQGCISTFNN